MPTGQPGPPQLRMTPEERSAFAKRAAGARWSRAYQRRLRRLAKVETLARDAYARADALLASLGALHRKPLAREVRRLFGAFCSLHQLDGHTLPEDMHAYLQGVTDYLKGEVTKRDGT